MISTDLSILGGWARSPVALILLSVHTCKDFANFFNFLRKNTVLNVDMRLLDLVFTNIWCEITHSAELLTFEDLYHPAINIVFELGKILLTSVKSGADYFHF